MISRLLVFLVLVSTCAAGPALPAAGAPVVPGERLEYSVSWAIVPGAGEIVVTAVPNGPDELKVITTTSTRRLAKLLLPFEATGESTYDLKTGRLVSLHERSSTRGKHAEHIISFDYEARQARYAVIGATRAQMLPMPEGSPADLIAALLDTRRWDLKPGEQRDSLVLFKDEFYELTIHALRYENIETRLGSFKALVLEPRMEKTPPKGMFAKGSTVQVWISQDERHLPVRFEVEFNIGTGVATLVSYTPPPAPETPAAPTATPPPAK